MITFLSFSNLRKLGYSTALLCLPYFSMAQSDGAAAEKVKQAYALEDDKEDYLGAIPLFKEAIQLNPSKKTAYSYEIAYAYYKKEQYQKTIETIESIKNNKDVDDSYFQLLGNSYDYAGQPMKATSTYYDGLEKFPKSGRLLMEIGNMYYIDKTYDKALDFYEQGIKAQPNYASNYYRAAKLYLKSKNEVYGMIYGEIFINLEPNTKRTEEMSKLLYDTYKSEIKISSESNMSVSFSENVISGGTSKPIKLPFGGVYETDLLLAALSVKTIDLNTLDQIRQKFVTIYFTKGNNKDYPNVLFDHQYKIKNAGHMEAYDHWLLMYGSPEAFVAWTDANKDKWTDFANWFDNNRLDIKDNNAFYRSRFE